MEQHPQCERQDGFTLVELLVVLGIIGILIAIMIPTLLSARTPAQDRQAQNLLRNSLTAAKAVEVSDGVIPDQTKLASAEPAVAFVPAAQTAPANQRQVSVANVVVGSTTYVVLASHSTSGRCFAVLEQAYQPPKFQRVDGVSTCQADQFDGVTGWVDQWP
ncbi:MAG: type II secretion system protein [Acidimicrobiia bacterium]